MNRILLTLPNGNKVYWLISSITDVVEKQAKDNLYNTDDEFSYTTVYRKGNNDVDVPFAVRETIEEMVSYIENVKP